MLDSKIGERVSFQPDGRPLMVGVLTRYNKKTVTVITEGGERWNVAPGLLHRVVESGNANAQNPIVVTMTRQMTVTYTAINTCIVPRPFACDGRISRSTS